MDNDNLTALFYVVNIIGNIISCAALVCNTIVKYSIIRSTIFGPHLRLLLASVIGCILINSYMRVIDCTLDVTLKTASQTFCISFLLVERFGARSTSIILAVVAYDRYKHATDGAMVAVPMKTVRDIFISFIFCSLQVIKRLLIGWLLVLAATSAYLVDYTFFPRPSNNVTEVEYMNCEPFQVFRHYTVRLFNKYA
jgi:hypothetical protein